MADEGDARDAADQAAEGRAGLGRGQRIHHCRDHARPADLRDAAAARRVIGASEVRGGRARSLRTLADCGVGAAQAALGDVELTVRAEGQPARIV